jgi:TRAP-type C4-dicarboxylate transport system permease small subunit
MHSALERVTRPVIRLAEYAIIVLGVLMVLIVFVQVILRYSTDLSFYGSEELTRFMLSWFIFLSAAVGLDRGIHFAVDTFIGRFPHHVARAVAFIAQLVVLSVLLIFFVKGVDMTARNWRQASSALEIPMSFGNAAIPTATLIMIAIVLRDIFKMPSRNAALGD